MPGPSTATGFSVKMFLPALTAASRCIGRKPGRRGQDDQVDAAVEHLLVGVEADEAAVVRRRRPCRRCLLRCRFALAVLEAVLEHVAHGVELDVAGRTRSDCSAAPVPRPPQPIRPTLIVSLPAAWTLGSAETGAVAAAAAAVEVLRKSRREAAVVRAGLGHGGVLREWVVEGESAESSGDGHRRRWVEARRRCDPDGQRRLSASPCP